MRKNIISIVLSILLSVALVSSGALWAYSSEENGFAYEHDPRLSEAAMADVVVNPSAVYGFSPSPDSERLGSYASADFSDPVAVAGWTKERIDYLLDFHRMYNLWDKMESQGKSTEEIARAVSALRNDIRLEAYKDNPEGLRMAKESNLKKYGNEYGPTAESLFEKYGSWEKVLEKSFSSNPGMDACLGLYDVEYDLNLSTGSLKLQDAISYTVKKNDNLSAIALRYYGHSEKWIDIFNANKSLIKDPNVILTGTVLCIPE